VQKGESTLLTLRLMRLPVGDLARLATVKHPATPAAAVELAVAGLPQAAAAALALVDLAVDDADAPEALGIGDLPGEACVGALVDDGGEAEGL
jgi:hypothetical protein